MSNYYVTLKPLEPRDENNKPNPNISYSVDANKAKEIQDAWDNHKNFRIHDSYMSYQRILEITAPPKQVLLEGPKYCGSCERGWVMGKNGAYPCDQCGVNQKQAFDEYKTYLHGQEWGKGLV